jgi:threonine dehydratase
MISLQDIEQAKERIAGNIERTPCPRSAFFSELLDCKEVYFKLENLQRTGSFKERGALNKMLMLTASERRQGVIAASAGNHAQGVAFHAGRLGIRATIVMPERTPLIKVTSTRGYGAAVVLHGANFDEAYAEALRIQEREGQVFIHPFNDPYIIAGQGTIGLEMLEQIPDLEVLVVPIGGGGMTGGIACAVKTLKPSVTVIGVQAEAVPSMQASVEAGRLVEVPAATTIADGIAVRRPGQHTYDAVKSFVDRIVTVDEEEIANAILLMLEREKTVAEGAGATPLAAMLNKKVPEAKGRTVGLVISGGNIDVTLISRIIERGLVKDGRMVRLMVTVPDRPGSLAKLVTLFGDRGANIVEIHHNRAFSRAALGEVEVEATLETRGRQHIEELIEAIGQKGWPHHVET